MATAGAPPSATYAYQIANAPGFLAMPATGMSTTPSVQPAVHYSVELSTSMTGM